MRWGHRKETRYKKGKRLYNERSEIWEQKEKELNKKSGLKDLADKAYKLADKYGLDYDDGGGGNTEKYSNATLRKASRQYMSMWDKYESIIEDNSILGEKYAREQIIKKYGNSAISDIDYYTQLRGQRNMAIALTVVGGLVYLGIRG